MPVTSAGIRSGVNWMRLKSSPKARASVCTINVLAVPGNPVTKQWPPINTAISNSSRTCSWPTTMRPKAALMAAMARRKSAAMASVWSAAWSEMESTASVMEYLPAGWLISTASLANLRRLRKRVWEAEGAAK